MKVKQYLVNKILQFIADYAIYIMLLYFIIFLNWILNGFLEILLKMKLNEAWEYFNKKKVELDNQIKQRREKLTENRNIMLNKVSLIKINKHLQYLFKKNIFLICIV